MKNRHTNSRPPVHPQWPFLPRFRHHSDHLRIPAGVTGLPVLPRPTFAGAGGSLMLLQLLLTGLFLLAQRSIPALADQLQQDTLRAFVRSAIISEGVLILLPTLFIFGLYHVSAEPVVGSKAQAGSLVLGFFVGIPAAVVFQGINNLVIYLAAQRGWNFPAATSPIPFTDNDLLQMPLSVQLAVLALAGLLPALIEELMFRGLILADLTSPQAGWSAIIWQAIAFSLFHNNPLFIVPPFLAGLLLGFLRLKSGSLLPSVLAHLTLNVSLLALNPLLPQLTRQYLSISDQTTQSLLYASLISACIAAVALVPLLILIGNLKGQVGPSKGIRWRLFPGDWKFALAIVVMIATMMVSYYQNTG